MKIKGKNTSGNTYAELGTYIAGVGIELGQGTSEEYLEQGNCKYTVIGSEEYGQNRIARNPYNGGHPVKFTVNPHNRGWSTKFIIRGN